MTSFDYIVVGAGSAGAVVAARLSESADNRVLLIEAGGSQKHMNVRMPAAFCRQFKSTLDWGYFSDPEQYLGGRRIFMPRAKMLGGCSSMNAMIYIRGSKADYDTWAKDGATGWSYADVLPLFRRSENNSRGADDYHGDSGPLYVQDLRSPNELSRNLVEPIAPPPPTRNHHSNETQQPPPP